MDCSHSCPVTGRRPSWVLAMLVVTAAVFQSPSPALADGKRLGTFKSWTAMLFEDKGATSCMLWSQPEKSTGKYTRRGEVFVFVTHRPAEKVYDRLTFETGYTYKKGTAVSILIDDEAHTLQTDGSIAWTATAEHDRALVKAMRAGRKMVVKGVSTRGTKTTDEFSLYGFSAAHKAIDKGCRR